MTTVRHFLVTRVSWMRVSNGKVTEKETNSMQIACTKLKKILQSSQFENKGEFQGLMQKKQAGMLTNFHVCCVAIL